MDVIGIGVDVIGSGVDVIGIAGCYRHRGSRAHAAPTRRCPPSEEIPHITHHTTQDCAKTLKQVSYHKLIRALPAPTFYT
eukprot:2271131-Pyramimonas_sp.AAC.1